MMNYKNLKPLEIELISLLNKAYETGYQDGINEQTETTSEVKETQDET